MSVEGRGRVLGEAVLIATGVVAVGLPLRDFDTTKRVIGQVFGRKVDCGSCIEERQSTYPFDAIVVPGGGLSRTADGRWEPSEKAKYRLEAASILHEQQAAPYIIILNGQPEEAEDGTTNVSYLRQCFENRGAVFPQGVIVNKNSINTRTDMKELRAEADKLGISRVLIDTNAFHEPRATLFACLEGLSASSVSAEAVVASAYPERIDEIRSSFQTPGLRKLAIKDALEVALMPWDAHGRLQTVARHAIIFSHALRKEMRDRIGVSEGRFLSSEMLK